MLKSEKCSLKSGKFRENGLQCNKEVNKLISRNFLQTMVRGTFKTLRNFYPHSVHGVEK